MMPSRNSGGQAACPFEVGEIIKERQHNGHDRTVIEIVPGECIVTMRGPRRSRIAWRNLRRYQRVGVSFTEVGR